MACIEPHREHIGGRVEIGGVYLHALSARAYAATLYVTVDIMTGGGAAPPTLTARAIFLHHNGMNSRKWVNMGEYFEYISLCKYTYESE